MTSFQDLVNYCYNNLQQIDFRKCQSISLAFLKLVKKEVIEQKLKRSWLESFVRFAKFNQNIINLSERIENQVRSLEKIGYVSLFKQNNQYSLKLTTSSRLIIGLGAEHPLETSITLHHIFGIPYIPGTALKGVCRIVAFWKIAQEKGAIKEENALKSFEKKFYGKLVKNSSTEEDEKILKYQLLFGAQEFKGLLLFLDAYPEISPEGRLFDLDVMNVHYKDYYSKGEPPADWQNPNPIFFLTVKKGIPFVFYVLFDEHRFGKIKKENPGVGKVLEDAEHISKEVENLLKHVLKNFGIGAKTALGYGIFE